MSLRVVFAPLARTNIREIIEWWRLNRPAAAGLVPRELKRVLRSIAESPNSAPLYTMPDIVGVRRCRIRRTPYHVYYQVNAEAGVVRVAAVWSSMRGSGPPLKR